MILKKISDTYPYYEGEIDLTKDCVCDSYVIEKGEYLDNWDYKIDGKYRLRKIGRARIETNYNCSTQVHDRNIYASNLIKDNEPVYFAKLFGRMRALVYQPYRSTLVSNYDFQQQKGYITNYVII